ncbi:MAG: carboxypeptidase regulatory-like domain-containing protein, partial [Bacteroidota bacterium]
MKNQISILVFLLCAFQSLFAQNEISGVVLDDQSQPAFFVTVALYEADEEHSLVKGVSTDANGRFVLKGIEDGAYSLEVSLIGSKPYQLDLNFPADHGKAFDVQLELDVAILQTVEVVGKVPLLVQKSDRLVVNIENNIIGLNSNMMDVMKKIPGMLVINDRLRMAGQSNITVLINGKTTRYVDVQSLLRDMPGSNVKSVEVIHQPGAEFDAEGTGAVINIILKKNSLFGTNGSINLGVAKGNDWKYTSNLSVSHYQGNLNINGSVGYKDYPYFEELRLTRTIGEDVYDQISLDPYANQSFRGNLGLDWDITPKHRVGFSSRFVDWSSDNKIINTTNIDFADAQEKDLKLITTNTKEESWDMYTFNPYYRFDIDTTGHRIDFD